MVAKHFEDLKSIYKEINTPYEFVDLLWEKSTKNNAAYNYIAGVIDCLRYTESITSEEYDNLIEKYLFS